MKRLAISVAVLIVWICQAATNPYYYVTGVDSDTFKPIVKYEHLWYDFGTNPRALSGIDICIMSNAAFARYAAANDGALYYSRAVTNAITAAQFNRVIDCLGTMLYGNCWLKSDFSSRRAYPSAIYGNSAIYWTSESALSTFKNCGWQFYSSYSEVSGISAASNKVATGEAPSVYKARRVFNALHKMRYCVTLPTTWFDSDGYYTFTKTVDDLDTPTSVSDPLLDAPSGRLAYYNAAQIGAVFSYDYPDYFSSRWQVKKYRTGGFLAYCYYKNTAHASCLGSGGDIIWLLRITRNKVDWTTLDTTVTTCYYILKGRTADFSEIFSEVGITDDVQCPERSDSLLSQMRSKFSGYGAALTDFTLVEVVNSLVVEEMDGEYSWNDDWKNQ